MPYKLVFALPAKHYAVWEGDPDEDLPNYDEVFEFRDDVSHGAAIAYGAGYDPPEDWFDEDEA